MEMLFERVAGLDVSKASVTVCVRTPGPVSAETRFAERRQRREARTPARYASTFRADAPHAAHAPPTGPGPGSLQARLQSWLQSRGSRPCAHVRRRSCPGTDTPRLIRRRLVKQGRGSHAPPRHARAAGPARGPQVLGSPPARSVPPAIAVFMRTVGRHRAAARLRASHARGDTPVTESSRA